MTGNMAKRIHNVNTTMGIREAVEVGRSPPGRAFGCAGTTLTARFRHSASIANAKGGGWCPSTDETPLG